MPQVLTPEALRAVGDPIAAGLLPAWEVTWVLLSQDDLDAYGASLDPPLPGPNLAIVRSIPERRIATAHVLSPWPDEENLGDTLHHELGHAWISPLSSQLEGGPSAVMLEEQLVETLGKYLQGLAGAAGTAARRALARVVEEVPARMRARISARALPAPGGQQMDPLKIKALIAAIKEQDGEAALQIAEAMLVEAASGQPADVPGAEPPESTPEPAAEVAKPEDGATMEKPKPESAPVGAPKPAEAARAAARLAQIDGEHTRARKAADAAVGVTIRARLRELRVDGVALPTAKEAELAKMTDLERFEERVGDILEGRKLTAPAASRARLAPAGALPSAQTPPPADTGAPAVTIDQLREEGAEDGFLQMYEMADETGKAGLLKGFRDPTAVQARARVRSMGPTGRALRAVRG